MGAYFLFVWSGVDSAEAGQGGSSLLGGWRSWEAAAEGLGFSSFVFDVVALAGAESSDFSRNCSIGYMF